VVSVVFLFAYGVASQSLLHPQSNERWWDMLYSVFYHPYLVVYQEFGMRFALSKTIIILMIFFILVTLVPIAVRGRKPPVTRCDIEMMSLC